MITLTNIIRLLLFLGSLFTTSLLAMPEEDQRLKSYWYDEGAEISKFHLEQNRYGAIHSGEAVLIFVTERFDLNAQVKADRPTERDLPILKLNLTKRFYTGIYPYTMMLSVFTPFSEAKKGPLKLTSSVQEWCGQTFSQLNFRDDHIDIKRFSYFQTDGDQHYQQKKSFSEDGLWTLLRLDPNALPKGKISMIPSLFSSRLQHTSLEPVPMSAELTTSSKKSLEGNRLSTYQLSHIDDSRQLTITFETDFPHRIQSWEEVTKDASSQKLQKTTAIRTHTLKGPYWEWHNPKDRERLKQLALEP